MILNRRTLLAAAASSLALRPATAQEAPDAITAYERETGGRAGLYAENLSTGRKIDWRAEERFVMCSTFKASLAAFVLARVDRGEEHLDAMAPFADKDLQPYAPIAKQHLARREMSVAEMCAGAVELSDNTCANLLLARSGGPAALTAFWKSNGDTVTRLDHYEPELNWSKPGDPHDTTTPAAMAGNLQRFVIGKVLSQESREHLIGWMLGCKTGDNRLRRPAKGLEDRRQDRQQRQGRLRRYRGRVAEAGCGRPDLRLRARRLAIARANGNAVCRDRPAGGATASVTSHR